MPVSVCLLTYNGKLCNIQKMQHSLVMLLKGSNSSNRHVTVGTGEYKVKPMGRFADQNITTAQWNFVSLILVWND